MSSKEHLLLLPSFHEQFSTQKETAFTDGTAAWAEEREGGMDGCVPVAQRCKAALGLCPCDLSALVDWEKG